MDDQTALILALQLVALSCIAAALLLYLLCRIRNRYHMSDSDTGLDTDVGLGRPVLVTSCDTAFGLQCALHLNRLGFRVFAGLKSVEDGDSVDGPIAQRILKAKMKEREMLMISGETDGSPVSNVGSLVIIPLDITREDMLHEAVGLIRGHLPAGEDGLWAVVNTTGLYCRGRLDQQDNAHWDVTFKHNVLGALRTARTFLPLLKNKHGRLVHIGADVSKLGKIKPGTVAYTASRYAIEGASASLRHELANYGVRVITLHPEGVPIDKLYGVPRAGNAGIQKSEGDQTVVNVQEAPANYLEYDTAAVPMRGMRALEDALLANEPQDSYELLPHSKLASFVCNVAEKTESLICRTHKKTHM